MHFLVIIFFFWVFIWELQCLFLCFILFICQINYFFLFSILHKILWLRLFSYLSCWILQTFIRIGESFTIVDLRGALIRAIFLLFFWYLSWDWVCVLVLAFVTMEFRPPLVITLFVRILVIWKLSRLRSLLFLWIVGSCIRSPPFSIEIILLWVLLNDL